MKHSIGTCRVKLWREQGFSFPYVHLISIDNQWALVSDFDTKTMTMLPSLGCGKVHTYEEFNNYYEGV